VGPHADARDDIHMPRESYEQDRQKILATLRESRPSTIAGVEVERVRDDDGFKFFLRDGSWVLLRTSGTEPLICVYSEAPTEEAVRERLSALEEVAGLDGRSQG